MEWQEEPPLTVEERENQWVARRGQHVSFGKTREEAVRSVLHKYHTSPAEAKFDEILRPFRWQEKLDDVEEIARDTFTGDELAAFLASLRKLRHAGPGMPPPPPKRAEKDS